MTDYWGKRMVGVAFDADDLADIERVAKLVGEDAPTFLRNAARMRMVPILNQLPDPRPTRLDSTHIGGDRCTHS